MEENIEEHRHIEGTRPLDTEAADDVIAEIIVDIADVCRMTHRTLTPEDARKQGIPDEDYETVLNTTTLSPITQEAIGVNTWGFRQKVAELVSPWAEQGLVEDGQELDLIDEFKLNEFIMKRGLDALISSQQEVQRLVEAVLANKKYQEAVSAYKNQGESDDDRAKLYKFLSSCGYKEVPTKLGEPFYHGISLGENGDDVNSKQEAIKRMASPEKYVEKILSILRRGILAGECPETLPELESVFCTEDMKYAHGIAAVGFKLDPGENLWSMTQGRSTGGKVEGRHLITPVLQRPSFELVLRSPSFYDALEDMEVHDIFGVVERKKYERFLINLGEHLRAAGLQFNLIDPDGSTYRASRNIATAKPIGTTKAKIGKVKLKKVAVSGL